MSGTTGTGSVVSPIHPWEREQTTLLSMGKAGKLHFSRMQDLGKGLSGYIVAAWDPNGGAEPTHFFVGVMDEAGSYWSAFADPSAAQYPLMYKTLGRALKRIQAEQAESSRWRIGLYLWFHPESDREAIEKYQKMIGHQYPSSPRQ